MTARRSPRKSSRSKGTQRRGAGTKPATTKPATTKRATTKRATTKRATTKRATTKRAVGKTKAARPRKSVYFFGAGRADGRAAMREMLGGKGANLAEMNRLGIPVPPGFTISTPVCAEFNKRGGRLPAQVKREVLSALAKVEKVMGVRFGDPQSPLLVSVRSGARVSMPGMMDTVLNLGLNDATVEGLAAAAGERFAFDSYRRFVQMYSNVALEIDLDLFESRIDEVKFEQGVELDTELDTEALRRLVKEFQEIAFEHTGRPFPQDPVEQLWHAIAAVFRSWENGRARTYRRLNGIPEEWGTAVNVQAMVFGNMGDDCATGVAFTRNPSTGAKFLYGEYLTNAQGEDVVAGIRTPQPINRASRTTDAEELPTLEQEMPKPYKELVAIYKRLEKHYRDMQDIEFTIQRGVLWLLQTRTGKRTTQAAVRIAVEMAKERLITRQEAILRVDADSLDQLLHPMLDPKAPREVLATGLPASPGAAVGNVVFSASEAEAKAKAGEKVVLVRIETSPEDIHGMHAAEGILTARGGMTSHAAVVARGMGKCCVAGCAELEIDYAAGEMRLGGRLVRAGEPITLDGSVGEVLAGRVDTVTPELGGAFLELMKWADRERVLKVRTNADSPQEARIAREFGCEGIGLCRTEHMFFEPSRILVVREMILAADRAEREHALAKLLPMQRGDFEGIFRAMEGLPVTIRLLDPPLHEFLPKGEEELIALAEALGSNLGQVRARVERLHEFNPMLGHRGCRLGISYPEIYAMQVRAIAEAAYVVASGGAKVRPEIMIPLVSHAGELSRLRALCETVIAGVRKKFPKVRMKIPIGTMIEVPRAAIRADEIAEFADFFSFGTNDLTQMAYALSRDDASAFLQDYMDCGILQHDPFVTIDIEGVGQLVELAVERGRRTRPGLKLGICGEHGADPRSVKFFARVGLDYVSASPYRVPLARLAAAQAALEQGAKAGRARKRKLPKV